jgi:hypothetical protein
MVCHVADKLAVLAGKIRDRNNMKRVIEAGFFPLNSHHDLSPPVSSDDAKDMIAPASPPGGDSRCDAIQKTTTIETSTVKL